MQEESPQLPLPDGPGRVDRFRKPGLGFRGARSAQARYPVRRLHRPGGMPDRPDRQAPRRERGGPGAGTEYLLGSSDFQQEESQGTDPSRRNALATSSAIKVYRSGHPTSTFSAIQDGDADRRHTVKTPT